MLLKFLVFCLVCYFLFRFLNFLFRLGRVVSTQKKAFEHVQNEFNRQRGASGPKKQRVGDVYIDHVPQQKNGGTSSGPTGSGEYVDYEEVKE